MSHGALVEGILTRESLFASGCFAMYRGRSPPGTQSEMSSRGSMVTPKRGTMFGCAERFEITATLWKAYGGYELV